MDQTQPDYSFKIVLTGNSGVGKTNFLSRFTQDIFNPSTKPTIGVEFAAKTIEIDGKTIKTQIWDTSGQEKFTAITNAYYRGVPGAILFYDITDPTSFDSLPQWLHELRKDADDNLVVILVANKCDLENQRKIPKEKGEDFAKREKLMFIEASGLNSVNVNETFTILITEILKRTSSRKNEEKENKTEERNVPQRKPEPKRKEKVELKDKNEKEKSEVKENDTDVNNVQNREQHEEELANKNENTVKTNANDNTHSDVLSQVIEIRIEKGKIYEVIEYVRFLEAHLSNYEKVTTFDFQPFMSSIVSDPAKGEPQKTKELKNEETQTELTTNETQTTKTNKEEQDEATEETTEATEETTEATEETTEATEETTEATEETTETTEETTESKEETTEKTEATEETTEIKEYLTEKSANNDDSNDDMFVSNEDEKFQNIVCKIGEGSATVAYKVIDTRDSRIMCKKVLKIPEIETAFKNIDKSLKTLESLHHINNPCLCKLIGVNTKENQSSSSSNQQDQLNQSSSQKNDDEEEEYFETVISKRKQTSSNTTISMFIEYVDFTLKDCLERDVLTNTIKSRIALEVAFGMLHLHKLGMIHRDLKIDNIMLNSGYEAKIINFGLFHISDIISKDIGTLTYMSPEMQNEDKYDQKTDVYSFGVVLYVMFTGKLPRQKMKDKLNKVPPHFPRPSFSISNICIELIKQCMAFEPSERPSFDKIIEYMNQNSFALAEEVDSEIVSRRYHELNQF